MAARPSVDDLWHLAATISADADTGKTPGPGGSLGKLFGSNIAWKMREIALEIAGMSSIAWDPADASGAER